MNDISQNSIAESKQLSADTFQTPSVPTKVQYVTGKATDSKGVDHKNPVVAIIMQAGKLWHNQEGKAGITIRVNEHEEHYLLEQNQFKNWLRNKYYIRHAEGISKKAFTDAMNTVKAMCSCEAQYQTYSRIGEDNGKIYIDLANDAWQAVEIDQHDWKIVNSTPIKFLRTKDMLPQHPPVHGGSIKALKPFLNTNDNDQFVLLVGFILKCFDPQAPYPLLAISGEQGSGKTELSHMIVSLVAPSRVPLRSMYRSEQDLLLGAKHNHLVAIDNLSGLTRQQSDWLCRLATDAGFSSRKLFSDSEESTIAVSRPIILNGIDDVIGRADLLDRAVVVHLPPLDENDRQSGLRQKFESEKPKILGALCDALVVALSNRKNVQLSRKPRMLEFAEFVTAAEKSFGWSRKTFLNAYIKNIEEVGRDRLALDPLAQAVLDHVAPNSTRELSATAWIDFLQKQCKDNAYVRLLPIQPNKFSSELKRIAPLLRREEVAIKHRKSGAKRFIRITRK